MLAQITTERDSLLDLSKPKFLAACLTQIGGEQESDVVVEDWVFQDKIDDHNAEKGPKANVAHSLHFHARLVYLAEEDKFSI